jgi:hypothetical protein
MTLKFNEKWHCRSVRQLFKASEFDNREDRDYDRIQLGLSDRTETSEDVIREFASYSSSPFYAFTSPHHTQERGLP